MVEKLLSLLKLTNKGVSRPLVSARLTFAVESNAKVQNNLKIRIKLLLGFYAIAPVIQYMKFWLNCYLIIRFFIVCVLTSINGNNYLARILHQDPDDDAGQGWLDAGLELKA